MNAVAEQPVTTTPTVPPANPAAVRKRLLFVDDEPLVLQGLQRMLYAMRGEWEMHFAESAAAGLELMARQPFDVVVSDMRMPGMNGAELLNRVMQEHPRTVRLILSGHADLDLIMKCVGATHQYLAKPCDAATLRATVQRVSTLEAILQNDTLQQFTARMDRLPSLPALYLEIVQKLQSPDVGVEEIAAIIARDIGMTAKILKLVNSAFFGISRKISNPGEAVAYLGTETIKTLALSAHAFAELNVPALDGFSIAELWRHSLQVGTAARAIARCEGAAPNAVEEAFAAGLLHDTGKLVFAAKCAQYSEVLRLATVRSIPLVTAEREMLGATHAHLGGYLLSLWGLPAPLVEAVTLHHEPASSPAPGFSALLAVHVANAFLHEAEGNMLADNNSHLDQAYLAASGQIHRLQFWREIVAESQVSNSIL